MIYDVFISYSWKDKETARFIYQELIRAGFTVFIDDKELSAGGSFPASVAENILNSNVFLYLGSNNSYNSGWAPEEFTFAKNHKDRNKILFYAIDNSPLPNWLDFASGVLNRRNINEHSLSIIIQDIREMTGRQSGYSPSTRTSYSLSSSVHNDEGESLLRSQQYSKAIASFKKGIEVGDANAMYNLGLMYINNIYVHNRKFEGIDLMLQAANAGLSKARMMLFQEANKDSSIALRLADSDLSTEDRTDIRHLLIKDRKADLSLAQRWLEEDAERGDKQSQYDLALMYQHGTRILPRDKQRAIYWFQRCIDYKDSRLHLNWLQSH